MVLCTWVCMALLQCTVETRKEKEPAPPSTVSPTTRKGGSAESKQKEEKSWLGNPIGVTQPILFFFKFYYTP